MNAVITAVVSAVGADINNGPGVVTRRTPEVI